MSQIEIQKAITRGLKTLEAPLPIRLSKWAAQHFYLSRESSYVEKPWESYPFQVAILDAFGNDDIAVVVVKKSARVGYTKMLLAAIGYFAHHKRRNQAVWQPTDNDAEEFVKVEVDSMLRDVKCMQEVFPRGAGNDKRDTLSSKVFLGSRLYIKGGKAARSYRRISVDTAIIDELDGFDIDIEKEGSPDKLAGKRTEGATFPKHIFGSTPKLKGLSRIEARSDECDLNFKFLIPCPRCGFFHDLRFGKREDPFGMKWVNRNPDSVLQVCPSPACGELYSQADYLRVYKDGVWTAEDGTWIDCDGRFRSAAGAVIPTPRAISFHIWTAYSEQATWPDIVRDYLAAVAKAKTGENSDMKTFVNTTLGETWEEAVEKTDADELMQRAEPYRLRTVPMGGLVLAAGVDVQSNRFEVVIWAFGRGEEMWVVDYHVIPANPADEREWEEKLDPFLKLKFPHASGQYLGIEGTGIDTGGHYTHQAYNFCRTREKRKIFAVKGEHRAGRPVKSASSKQDVNWKGTVLKGGVKLWLVGTDTAKDLIHGRLHNQNPGPGYIHFSDQLSVVFYEQLTAESRVLQKTATGEQYKWHCPRGLRNEVLDCTVYAIFVAHMLELHRYTEKMWDKLKSAVCPTPDLFASQDSPEPELIAAPVPLEVDRTPVPITRADPAPVAPIQPIPPVQTSANQRKSVVSRLA